MKAHRRRNKWFDPYIAVREFSAFSVEDNCFRVKGFHSDKLWFYKVLLQIECYYIGYSKKNLIMHITAPSPSVAGVRGCYPRKNCWYSTFL